MGVALTTSLLFDVKEAVKDHLETNFAYMGFGTGTSDPTASDTALDTEVVRIARQEYSETASVATSSFYLDATKGNGSDIAEIGAFDTTTAGANEMQSRATLSVAITKTSDIEVWVDSNITVTVTDDT